MATVKAYITMPFSTYEAMQAHCDGSKQARDQLINTLLINHLTEKEANQ